MNRSLLLGAAAVGGYALWDALRPRYDFRGKTVLVTGGTRGLGLELARQLVRRGAKVAVCGRDEAELGDAVRDLLDHGPAAIGVRCDVTDRGQVRRFVAAAKAELGPCDVLVHNAGIIGVGPFESQADADVEASLRTHLWAAWWLTQDVLPDMKARGGGRILNVASFGGKVGVPHLAPYCAGKFALVGLSQALRAELGRYGVVVTAACPGLMRTGSHLHAEFKGRYEEEYRWFAAGNGLPGLSMNSARAARLILDACATGRAEAVLTLPAKAAVAFQAAFPTLFADLSAVLNRVLLPEPGGVGVGRVKGRDSRGRTPAAATVLSDRAAAANNEHHAGRSSVGPW